MSIRIFVIDHPPCISASCRCKSTWNIDTIILPLSQTTKVIPSLALYRNTCRIRFSKFVNNITRSLNYIYVVLSRLSAPLEHVTTEMRNADLRWPHFSRRLRICVGHKNLTKARRCGMNFTQVISSQRYQVLLGAHVWSRNLVSRHEIARK